MRIVCLCAALCAAHSCPVSPCKVLCLHGGGESKEHFESSLAPFRTVANDVELVFVEAPYPNALWILDAPGGKGAGTDDSAWDALSTGLIRDVVESQGPFYGILGFSQGTAALISYLSMHGDDFEVVMAFSAYLPSTHRGINGRVLQGKPYHHRSFIYSGTHDTVIHDSLTEEYAGLFDPDKQVRVVAVGAGHRMPAGGSCAMSQAGIFLNSPATQGSRISCSSAANTAPVPLMAAFCSALILLLFFT